MMGSRRQLAATLGRIYPYRAAKQQAPGVAAADAMGFPNRSGMTSGLKQIPGQAGDDGQAGDLKIIQIQAGLFVGTAACGAMEPADNEFAGTVDGGA